MPQVLGLALSLRFLDLVLQFVEGGVAGVFGQKLRLVDGTEQCGDGDLALAVYFDGDDVLVGGLKLQPGASVRDELCVAEVAAAGGVTFQGQVDAGGAH